jgi:hypothetical protein
MKKLPFNEMHDDDDSAEVHHFFQDFVHVNNEKAD